MKGGLVTKVADEYIGGAQKTLDLDLTLPSTGERGFIQAKSRTEFGFTLTLLRAAIEREALIVIMRHARAWRRVAPELDAYESRSARVFQLNSPLSVHLTPNNCPGYSELVSVLAARQSLEAYRAPASR